MTAGGRRRAALNLLAEKGESARPGEEVTGQVLGHDDRVASIVSDERIIAVDRTDLPERLPDDEAEITFTARSDFSRLGREPKAIEAPAQAERTEATGQDTPPAEPKAIETDIAAQRARERDSEDRGR
ncbi:MAG: hypothetical protein EOQ56_36940 [Mesorhizobium sp.]|nr:MAG: hypothetical protein EOQ56_36940 [Mesorhizobium sp.]